jgi:hypothetical protein
MIRVFRRDLSSRHCDTRSRHLFLDRAQGSYLCLFASFRVLVVHARWWHVYRLKEWSIQYMLFGTVCGYGCAAVPQNRPDRIQSSRIQLGLSAATALGSGAGCAVLRRLMSKAQGLFCEAAAVFHYSRSEWVPTSWPSSLQYGSTMR